MLGDRLDGYGRTPEDVLAELQAAGGQGGHGIDGGMGHDGMNMSDGTMGGGSMMGGLAGDVAYPLHLINGRAPVERQTFDARPGQKVWLRLINAGSRSISRGRRRWT